MSATSAGPHLGLELVCRQRPRDPRDADDVDLVGGALERLGIGQVGEQPARPAASRELEQRVDAAGEVVAVERDPKLRHGPRPKTSAARRRGADAREGLACRLAVLGRRPCGAHAGDTRGRAVRVAVDAAARQDQQIGRPDRFVGRVREPAPLPRRKHRHRRTQPEERRADGRDRVEHLGVVLVELVADPVGVEVIRPGEPRQLLPGAERDPDLVGPCEGSEHRPVAVDRHGAVAAEELADHRARSC